MNAEAVAVVWLAAVLVAWSGVCWCAGAIWQGRHILRQRRRQQAEDLTARDEWANHYRKEHQS